jgi:hypothetical protein
VRLQVVNKVRGQLSSLERKILSALIVVDVHARDVAAELASKGVTSETDFDFVSQLRYGCCDMSALQLCSASSILLWTILLLTASITVELCGDWLTVHCGICVSVLYETQHSRRMSACSSQGLCSTPAI